MKETNLTPKQITEHLNKYIVGQEAAKKAVAVALRNRYRRQLLDDEMKNEVIPKEYSNDWTYRSRENRNCKKDC